MLDILPFFQTHYTIIAWEVSLPQPPDEFWRHISIWLVDVNNNRFVDIWSDSSTIASLNQCSQPRLEVRNVEIDHMPLQKLNKTIQSCRYITLPHLS